MLASYGGAGQSTLGSHIELGAGLVGQCAIEKEKILLSNVPLDYITDLLGLRLRAAAEHPRCCR